MKSSSGNADTRWSLVTNHGNVLVYLAGDPYARLRDVADHVGITERAAAQIVKDLEQAGHLTKTRVGRRNRYQIDGEMRVRTPRLPMMTIAQVLALLLQALEQPFAYAIRVDDVESRQRTSPLEVRDQPRPRA